MTILQSRKTNKDIDEVTKVHFGELMLTGSFVSTSHVYKGIKLMGVTTSTDFNK